MQFEVEQKFPVADVESLFAQLRELGVSPGPAVVQDDCYFAHPCRDFAATDEALRIRSTGGQSYVTYKGPKLGTGAKTRREIELPLDGGVGERFAELLKALGFSPVAEVRKSRRAFAIHHDGLTVQGALDAVDGLGDFIELELLAEEGGLSTAERIIQHLAAKLDLGAAERRSYLELLLAR